MGRHGPGDVLAGGKMAHAWPVSATAAVSKSRVTGVRESVKPSRSCGTRRF